MINGVKIEELRKWLKSQGAELRELTNEWEVLRFKVDNQVRVVYKRANGRLTYDEKTAHYAQMCRDGRFMKNIGFSNGWARNIIKRGNGLKALLLSATTGPERVESCRCKVLPWEDCEHTAPMMSDLDADAAAHMRSILGHPA